jgi:hypothetical protein
MNFFAASKSGGVKSHPFCSGHSDGGSPGSLVRFHCKEML